MSLQVKDLFKELNVECNVVELDLIGKMEMFVQSVLCLTLVT